MGKHLQHSLGSIYTEQHGSVQSHFKQESSIKQPVQGGAPYVTHGRGNIMGNTAKTAVLAPDAAALCATTGCPFWP